MPEWLSPTDSWPSHPYAEVRKALREARHAGWWLRPAGSSGHAYGLLYCRRTDDVDYCKFAVWTTAGRDTEDTAHRVREKLARCQHVELPVWQDPDAAVAHITTARLNGARFHMDRAEHLIIAVEGLLEYRRLRHRATALIEDAQRATEEAGRLLREAEEYDERADQIARRARESANEAGMGAPPWPPEDDESRLVDPAQHELDTAEGILAAGIGQDIDRVRHRGERLLSRLLRCRRELQRGED